MDYMTITQKGLTAIVEPDIYDNLTERGYKFYIAVQKDYNGTTRHGPAPSLLAVKYSPVTKGNVTITVARETLGLVKGDGMHADHINHDTLDNRRENLRKATPLQNCWNKRPAKNARSKYKGVGWHNKTGAWRARITVHGKRKELGYFASEEDAAKAYDKAAAVLHGDFAWLNFPEQLG